MVRSAVDDAPDLALGELRRRDDASAQFGCDGREGLVIADAAQVQLPVSAPHDGLQRFAMPRQHVIDDARCFASTQTRRCGDPLDKFVIRHTHHNAPKSAGIPRICPESGKCRHRE